jgi:hypothetical protein
MYSNIVRKSLVAVLTVLSIGWLAIASAEDTESQLEVQGKRTDDLAITGGETLVTDRIVADFKSLAGSDANATALVTGLRNGTAITFTSGGTTSTFTPATGKMGWGNVFISLALAQAELKAAGITSPTSDQIQAALNGGTVTTSDGKTVTLQGILAQRASGMGWGQIAKSAGINLGLVIARIRSGNDRLDPVDARADRQNRPDSAGNSNHPERPARPQRPDRPERPGKV